jgi:hypothetical protein
MESLLCTAESVLNQVFERSEFLILLKANLQALNLGT